jgi:hypothetical protein
MTDAGYVITGWALTGAAIAAYTARVLLRIRRLEREDDRARSAR